MSHAERIKKDSMCVFMSRVYAVEIEIPYDVLTAKDPRMSAEFRAGLQKPCKSAE
jgi:hypothetical protein